MPVTGLHHVRLAAPPGAEAEARRFYGELLGLPEVAKPDGLAGRGGAWFAVGAQQLHVGADADFTPATTAHPALAVDALATLEAVADRLTEAGVPIRWDDAIGGVQRLHCADPWGNRLEILVEVTDGARAPRDTQAMETLFEPPADEEPDDAVAADAPLAARRRPRSLDEFVGQEHLLRRGGALRTAIETGHPHSMVLFGPPGTGKTTLARIVARAADAAFEELSAVEVGRAQVRDVIARAQERRRRGTGTIFFLDEIHRFNKAQQDALLPAVEDGLVTLIGATTENPYFEVNAALLSRCQVYELHQLTAAQVRTILERTGVAADEAALDFLADRSGGDARTALSALEIAETPVDLVRAEDALQRRAIRYDRDADQHYDTISAWIKATRASDPDASLYYLAIMLEGGEDPRFIVRRMVVLASEDIGNADPGALSVAVDAAAAVEHVGLPECQYALAQAAIYLALAPKSNAATVAIAAARAHVRDRGAQLPPDYLRSAAYPAARKLGRGQGYDYPHTNPGHVSGQEMLPDAVAGTRFYEPDEAEAGLRERLAALRKAREDLA